MAATVLGWLGLFGLGCYVGRWFAGVGHQIDLIVLSALGPPDHHAPHWLFDDESWPA